MDWIVAGEHTGVYGHTKVAMGSHLQIEGVCRNDPEMTNLLADTRNLELIRLLQGDPRLGISELAGASACRLRQRRSA
jgi:hypothetical protein